MPTRYLFIGFCTMTGVIVAAIGALVPLAQFLEWYSFGNWNPVSVQYACDYFGIPLPHRTSIIFSRLPLGISLLVVGGLIAVAANRQLRK